jgi:hypothetical protein
MDTKERIGILLKKYPLGSFERNFCRVLISEINNPDKKIADDDEKQLKFIRASMKENEALLKNRRAQGDEESARLDLEIKILKEILD